MAPDEPKGPQGGLPELRNPFTSQTIRFVTDSEELLVLESSYEAGSPPAPAHLHPSQEERFTVLAGAVEVSINGEPRTLREGDELIVPAGTPHEFGGHATEAGTVRWEVRPALRTREFFIGLFAALQAASDGSPESAPFDFADYADEFRPA
jgi:quercetin dioxygenase-like cupin family protein